MNRSLKQMTVRALLALAALAATSIAVGCGAEVEGGSGGGGGGGGRSDDGGGGGGGGGGAGEADAGCFGMCKSGEIRGCTSGQTDWQGNPIPGTARCIGDGCNGQWGPCEVFTPIVLSFDNAPVHMIADATHGFTLSPTSSVTTDWPTAKTPWLALDIDGSGAIEDGSELFGSMTTLKSGGRAVNGFVALRELDADGDGKITAADPGFVKLLIWRDHDGDRRSLPEELAAAASARLLSIDLDYTSDPRCDERGNCEIERASFRYWDTAGMERTGAVIDVHLRAQRW